MAFILFILEAIIFSLFERKIYGTIFTPAAILGFPYILAMSFSIFWGESFGFYPVYINSVWVWTIGYFIFCSVDVFLSTVLIGKTDVIESPFVFIKRDVYATTKLLRVVASVCVPIMYYKLWMSLKAFGMEYTSEEFAETLGHGINAHANILLLICVIFFIATTRFKWKDAPNILFILLWLVYAFFYNSKSWVLIPVLAGLMGRFLFFRIKLKLVRVALIVVGGILVFYLSYSISFGKWAPWWFIKKHFITYTNSGILALSEHVRTKQDVGLSFELLFQPFANIYYVLTGDSAKTVLSDLRISIGTNYSSNIRTFFGTIYVFGGLGGGVITTIVWAFVIYFPLALVTRFGNIIIGIIYLFLAYTLIYGWFDPYLNKLPAYEIFFLGIFILVMDLYNNHNGKISYHYLKN